MLSKRIQQLVPSPTVGLNSKVKQLQSQGVPIINLGIGEPDFNTPKNIQNAAIRAIRDGYTHYTQTGGYPELRSAICTKFRKDNNIAYDPSEVFVDAGSKVILYMLFQILCDKADEVIIPIPSWSTYIEQAKLADAKVVTIQLQPPFKLSAEDVKKTITKKTKVLVLNSPANPTGAVIDREELVKIAKLAIEHNFYIISDEIYEKIIYDANHVSIASLGKEIKSRTITVNGLSKAYAMTGWRIGYAGGPKEIITAATNLQGQLTFHPTSIAQKAAFEALTGNQESVEKMAKEFKKRRDFLTQFLSSIDDISFTPPEGAFYLYFNVERLLGKTYLTSSEWCMELLEKENVALVPGEAFNHPGSIRLSFAASLDELKNGVERIVRFIENS